MSTSSKYTTLPLMSPSLTRRPGLASDLRLLNDGDLLALLVLVGGLADDEHHLARASRFFIHVGDPRLQGNGVARSHRSVKLTPLSGIERDLAELHLWVRHPANAEDIIEDRWGDQSSAAGGFRC